MSYKDFLNFSLFKYASSQEVKKKNSGVTAGGEWDGVGQLPAWAPLMKIVNLRHLVI